VVEAPKIFKQSAHEGDRVVSRTHWLPLLPGMYLCYSFTLYAELTPALQCGQKVKVNEKLPTHQESNVRPSSL
jgi:hypothetical protein